MAKQRASKLDQYAEQLTEWFLLNLSLRDAQLRLKNLNCSVSLSRLSSWWEQEQQRRSQTQMLERIAIGSQQCAEIEKQFGKNPPPEISTLIKIMRTLIMQLTVRGQTDPAMLKLATSLIKPVMDHLHIQEREKDRELEERRVKLLEQRASQAEKAEQVASSDASPEEKEQRIKSIFGMS